MWQGMKSVMVIESEDTDEMAVTKFADWMRDNHSAVGDKVVPGVKETQEYLRRYA